MKIAIVGAGLSGLHAASTLYQLGHTITVFEAGQNLGGHVQTQRVPFDYQGEKQEAIVDLGVFMFDPVFIHPYLYSLVKDKLELDEIPLDFTLALRKKASPQLCWKTDYVNKEVSKSQIFLNNLKKTILDQGLFNPTGYQQCIQHFGLMKDIFRFQLLLENLSTQPEYKHFTIADFIKHHSFSDELFKYWILPQMHCWWGSTRESFLNSSIQVFADSVFKVSRQPQYTFKKGVDSVVQLLSEPIQDFIHTATPIKNIIRTPERVIVNGAEFDALLLAIPPCAALNSLATPSKAEKALLSSYDTTTTIVLLHTDETTWFPPPGSESTVNLIQDEQDLVSTFWVGRLHPLAPSLFLSWGDNLKQEPNPDKILNKVNFLRTLPTINTVKASEDIQNLQGQNRTWYCGAHVHALGEAPHSLWSDNALKSGFQAAQAIHQVNK